MQYDVQTPDEYLAALPDDWRRATLLSLRDSILSRGVELSESIKYKMLSYQDERGAIFHLNAQKNYVSLYVADVSLVESGGHLLGGLSVGKACIRFSKSVRLDDTSITDFIAYVLDSR